MKIYLFFHWESHQQKWKKVFQNSPLRPAWVQTLSPCLVPPSQLTEVFVSLRLSLAHQWWDFLMEKTPVSLDLKQIFKIRFVKRGSITNTHKYSCGFCIFLANYPSGTEPCTQYIEQQSPHHTGLNNLYRKLKFKLIEKYFSSSNTIV